MVNDVLAAAAADDELRADLKGFLNTLMARKKAHFSQYNRVIVDFELTERRRGDLHLSVASTLEPDT
jgi:hypothetical protein